MFFDSIPKNHPGLRRTPYYRCAYTILNIYDGRYTTTLSGILLRAIWKGSQEVVEQGACEFTLNRGNNLLWGTHNHSDVPWFFL